MINKAQENSSGVSSGEIDTDKNRFLCNNGGALSNETLTAFAELGEVLKGIHQRMLSEGYEIVDGTIRMKTPQNGKAKTYKK